MQNNVQYQPQYQQVQGQAMHQGQPMHPQQMQPQPVMIQGTQQMQQRPMTTTIVQQTLKPNWTEMPRPGCFDCGNFGNCVIWWCIPCVAVEKLYIVSKDESRKSLMFILLLIGQFFPILRLVAMWMIRNDVYEQMEVTDEDSVLKDFCCILCQSPCYMNQLQENITQYDKEKRQLVGAAMKVSHMNQNYGTASTVVTMA